jgi:hypothetical protein
MSPTDLTEAHLEAIGSLQEYFYYTVWRYPALKISTETATGPSADEVIAEHREEYRTFGQTVETRREAIVQELDSAGLYPDLTEYPDREGDSISETIGDLMSVYQNRSG